ncbi:MAG: sialidase family protein, partial [Candidatus Latescibacterota bacterium]
MGEWQEHYVHQGNGQGGWTRWPAHRQVLRHPDSDHTMPFGLARMDNGEIVLLCSREKTEAGVRTVEPIVSFSQDEGATWSAFRAVPGTTGRPQYLHWLGGGRLSFVTEVWGKGARPQRVFSEDYGRSWTDSVEHPLTEDGHGFGLEGNGWVDRDGRGMATAVLEIGYYLEAGKTHPTGDYTGVFRRSSDGGRTWTDEVSPPQWKFTAEHQGTRWLRGVSEGAVVRAANGDLVAALRTDMPAQYFAGPHDDSLEGTAISVSRDNGRTWSDMEFLFAAGRHHANLQRLANGDLVCTLIVRDDIRPDDLRQDPLTHHSPNHPALPPPAGHPPPTGPATPPAGASPLSSHRRGCDALVSHDHGRTWNLSRR